MGSSSGKCVFGVPSMSIVFIYYPDLKYRVLSTGSIFSHRGVLNKCRTGETYVYMCCCTS